MDGRYENVIKSFDRICGEKYSERLPYLETVRAGLEEGFSRCTPEEAALMRFFYGTMPLRDAGEYDFRVFLSFVRHGLWLREHVAWCAAFRRIFL